ncbi:hypothetical protein HHK36_012260 [Tetracentron sinense]|uniref:Transmembrane protein n=1 Tax=Tetracentron sinense TaxID=13715 RepID=A0A835DFK5_TETSI|nr:hypothetical protein HHK36_012260 [Tetracentron sinense]
MGGKKWEQKAMKLLSSPFLREPFYIFTLTLLSLLLPLSFLLLPRLSAAQYLLTFTPSPIPHSILSSLFLFTSPTLHLLVSFVSITALLHGLMGPVIVLNKSSSSNPRYIAWILLCTLQVCVGLGIEGTIAAALWPVDSVIANERTLFSPIIFFVGLHETMLHWSRMIVRPVVDDTVFGVAREERWVERAVMAASFGTLWWWRLRDEVEALVVVAELKMELLKVVGVADFVGWWLYYLTVTIGMVRLVKGLIWVGQVFLCKRRGVLEGNSECSGVDDDKV